MVGLAEAVSSAAGAGVLSVVGLTEAVGGLASDSKQRSVKTCGIDLILSAIKKVLIFIYVFGVIGATL